MSYRGFRELEALLAEPPSALAFRALSAHLDRWPGDRLDEALEHAGRALDGWPDALRVAPWSWVAALRDGHTKPTWRLVRRVELASRHLDLDPVPLAEVATAPELAGLTCFDLAGDDIDAFVAYASRWAPRAVTMSDARGLARHAAHPVWAQLERLAVCDPGEDTFHGPPPSMVPALGASLEELTIRADDLVALWAEAATPRLRKLTVFVLSEDDARALARRPELARIEALTLLFRCAHDGRTSFEPSLGHAIPESDRAAEIFFASAHLDGLKELAVIGRSSGYWTREGNGPRTVHAMIRARILPRLERLRLELLPLGDEGLLPLAAQLGEPLRSLELVDVHARDATAEALARSPALAGLERLDLSANRIRARGFERLAEVGYARLRELDVSGPACSPYYFRIGEQPVRDDGIRAWMASSAARTLSRLSARAARLTDGSLEALARSEARQLTSLDLAHNDFRAPGVRALAAAPFWTSLRTLSLADCLLDDQAIAALTACAAAPALRELRLDYNAVGPRGAGSLAAWPPLAAVWDLGLHDNLLGDEGLSALCRSPYAGRLLELDLEQDCWNFRARSFDRAAEILATTEALPRLDAIFAGIVDEYHGGSETSGFTPEGLALLRASERLRPEARASLRPLPPPPALARRGEPRIETEEQAARRRDHDFRYHARSSDDDPDVDPEPRGPRIRQV